MTFASAAGISNLEKSLIFREHYIKQSDIQICVALESMLTSSAPGPSYIKDISNSRIYRITCNSNPLDAGLTFANGGRVNVGISQCCSEMPNLRASYGVYVALEKETALAEVGSTGLPFARGDLFYEITLQKSGVLKVIDFDSVVSFIGRSLSGVNLMAAIQDSPAAALWCLQKWPKPSQIVAEWLRVHLSSKSDGIMYRSTKNPNGYNIFLFSDGPASLKGKFNYKTIPLPE